MFRFIKKTFFTLSSFCGSLGTKRVSINNQPYQIRLTLMDVNSNKCLFYPYVLCLNRFCGSCNTIDDPCALIRIPDKVSI